MVDVRCHVLCIVVLMRYCPGRSPRVQCSAFSRYAIGWIWGIKQLRIASIVFASWREFLRYHMDLRELLFRDGEGASVIRHCAPVVFGKGITSRIDSVPAISAAMRSMPKAIPPCGGAP